MGLQVQERAETGEHRMMTTIDCDTCPARGPHCGECVVPLLVPGWTDEQPLGRAERAAVGCFVRAGLIAPAAADRLRSTRTAAGWTAVG